MLHLDPERLAALADDEPTAAEAAHLSECAECARERDASRAIIELAARQHSAVVPPSLVEWTALSARLREEGLVTSGGSRSRITRLWSRPWLNAAAAVLLVVGGGAVGRWSAGIHAGAATPGAVQSPNAPDRDAQMANAQRTPGSTGGVLTSNALSPDSVLSFHSTDEALETMRVAERTYRGAMAYIAAQDTSADAQPDPARYRARLAALDRMSGAALAAVNEAPHDPVINQYYLSTVSARQATLRQLDRALPSGVKLVSY
ncbi:MAG TPA: hypothetical protein VF166_03460 [Gemmatimonadaceae bacterium]